MLLKIALSTLIGGGLGYAYYYFVGCQGGTCPLQSNPYVTTIYGSFLGIVFSFT